MALFTKLVRQVHQQAQDRPKIPEDGGDLFQVHQYYPDGQLLSMGLTIICSISTPQVSYRGDDQILTLFLCWHIYGEPPIPHWHHVYINQY